MYFGIDIGGTNVKTALVDDQGVVHHKQTFETLADRGFEDFCARTYKLFQQSVQAAGITEADVAGVGVGVPGFLDVEQGVVLEAVNLGWANVPLVSMLQSTFHLPVAVENDANLAALGESWMGAGRNRSTVLCVTVGTGIGAGIVIKGRLHRGANGMAGEIGHLVVKREHGYPCNCGNYGCLETVASATAIVRMASERLAQAGTPTQLQGAEDVFTLAEAGNKIAQEVVMEAADWLAYGLSLAAVTINPDAIVLGGGVSKAHETFLRPVKAAFPKYTLPLVVQSADISLATLGNDAGFIGAARLIAQHLENI